MRPMRSSRSLLLLLGALPLQALAVGCSDIEAADIRLKIDTPAPNDLLLGSLPGYPGEPGREGRHYVVWAGLGDGSTVRAAAFVIIPTSAEDAPKYQVPEGAAQLRNLDTGDFVGLVSTSCFLGPCGGARIVSPTDLSSIVSAVISREDDDAEGDAPSDDVILRGPILPYARGTLRGSLVDPSGAATPRAEMTVIPADDGATL